MAQILLKNIKKDYGDVKVVKGIDLDIKDNEFVVLVGPSGCGKSTTLRMIAGLEDITSGQLLIDGKLANDLPPSDRGLTMVFQNYALYPHMSVYENMSFGLRLKKLPADQIKQRINKTAEILGLTSYLQRKPKELSGGQRQRVAMGRAMVKDADIILYDEPLSNLDAKLRMEMRIEIKKQHLRQKKTTIYVTHDQVEAMTLADRLVLLNNGRIEQVGTPLSVFQRPMNKFVASFIGSPGMNFFDLNIERKDSDIFLVSDCGKLRIQMPENKLERFKDYTKPRITFGLRPSDIFIAHENDQMDSRWRQKAKVEVIELLGKNAFLELTIGKISFMGEIAGNVLPALFSEVELSFNLHHMHLFDIDTEQRVTDH
jgi:multiple sugar transport system ATP-binding protein